jgi:hypothetical protein
MQNIRDSKAESINIYENDHFEAAIDVQIFHNFEIISNMQQKWDRFIEDIKGEIFLTFDWCQLWWKYYGEGRHLKIFIFRLDGNLVGILPMFMEKIWLGPLCVRIIKIVGTDFTPITISVPIQKVFLKQVMSLFIHKLNQEWKWDVLHIGDICGRYDSFDFLATALKNTLSDAFHIFMNTNNVQTYFYLTDSLEKQIAKLNKKQRENIRRAYRSAESQGTLNSSLASDENFNEYFDDFVHLHQRQWENIGQPGHFRDWPHSYEFHRDFATTQLKKGRLRLLKIAINNQCIGYKYGYKFGDLYHQFLSARIDDKSSTSIDFNKISFGEQVRLATTVDKVVAIDSMRGKYDHKIHLGGEMLPVRSIDIYPKKIFIILRITIFKYLSLLIDICYSKIWRRRIMTKLGLNSRPIWSTWIKTSGVLLLNLYKKHEQ